MRKVTMLRAVAAATGVFAAWQIQERIHEDEEGLLARAAISIDAARTTALAAVPNGRVEEAEIEEESGRLIYAFDIVIDGQMYDVEVDAMTGELIQAVIEDEEDDDDGDGDHDD